MLAGYSAGGTVLSRAFSNEAILSAFNPRRVAEAGEPVQREVVPLGITIGVRINTEGVMVLGTGAVKSEDGTLHNPSEGKLRAGDLILTANGKDLANKEDLMSAISESGERLILRVKRDHETIETTITPIKSDGSNMIGSWIRDSTQGIGTVTYFNPATGTFGALGHGIMDVDTGRPLTVRCGHMYKADILDIRKGRKGLPGEIVGLIEEDNIIGDITKNTPLGIYGNINIAYKDLPLIAFETARHTEIERGPARILSNIEGGEIKSYDVYIESINQDHTADKAMVIRITDQSLITRSGGIVQGMSGSPIIQNEKLIGAITHVFVQNPLRGYGVSIDKMLAASVR
jgi:stage IV sporulation protein B